jgi:hypothetical protein
VDELVISRFSAKDVQAKTVEITVSRLEEIIALSVAKWDISGRTASNRRRKKPDTAIIKPVTIITVIVTKKTMTHRMWYLRLRPKMRDSRKIFVSVTVELVDIIETILRDFSMLKRSKRTSRLVMAKL